jgi:hypothetical protein
MKIDKNSIAVVSGEKVVTVGGKDVTSLVSSKMLETAVKKGERFFWLTDDGKWVRELGVGENRRLGKSVRGDIMKFINGEGVVPPTKKEKVEESVVEEKVEEPEVFAFKEFVHNSVEMRPELLKMPDLKWKYLVRSVLKGKNIMMVGPSGSGKTFAVQQLTKALNIKTKTKTKRVSREELNSMKQNMKIEIGAYKKVS